ncbi:hypothetical protein L9F63_011258, partial [Diploptera punctata]
SYGHKQVDDLQLRSGTSFVESGGTLHAVSYYLIHPHYNDKSRDFDIAVVK